MSRVAATLGFKGAATSLVAEDTRTDMSHNSQGVGVATRFSQLDPSKGCFAGRGSCVPDSLGSNPSTGSLHAPLMPTHALGKHKQKWGSRWAKQSVDLCCWIMGGRKHAIGDQNALESLLLVFSTTIQEEMVDRSWR